MESPAERLSPILPLIRDDTLNDNEKNKENGGSTVMDETCKLVQEENNNPTENGCDQNRTETAMELDDDDPGNNLGENSKFREDSFEEQRIALSKSTGAMTLDDSCSKSPVKMLDDSCSKSSVKMLDNSCSKSPVKMLDDSCSKSLYSDATISNAHDKIDDTNTHVNIHMEESAGKVPKLSSMCKALLPADRDDAPMDVGVTDEECTTTEQGLITASPEKRQLNIKFDTPPPSPLSYCSDSEFVWDKFMPDMSEPPLLDPETDVDDNRPASPLSDCSDLQFDIFRYKFQQELDLKSTSRHHKSFAMKLEEMTHDAEQSVAWESGDEMDSLELPKFTTETKTNRRFKLELKRLSESVVVNVPIQLAKRRVRTEVYCNICTRPFHSVALQRKHEKQHALGQLKECPYCCQCLNAAGMAHHVAMLHGVAASKVEKMDCAVSSDDDSVADNESEITSETSVKVSKKSRKEPPREECPLCHKKFIRMITHFVQAHGDQDVRDYMEGGKYSTQTAAPGDPVPVDTAGGVARPDATPGNLAPDMLVNEDAETRPERVKQKPGPASARRSGRMENRDPGEECRICRGRFDDLVSHFADFHPGQPVNFIFIEPVPHLEECQVCHQKYKNLSIHMKAKHGEKPSDSVSHEAAENTVVLDKSKTKVSNDSREKSDSDPNSTNHSERTKKRPRSISPTDEHDAKRPKKFTSNNLPQEAPKTAEVKKKKKFVGPHSALIRHQQKAAKGPITPVAMNRSDNSESKSDNNLTSRVVGKKSCHICGQKFVNMDKHMRYDHPEESDDLPTFPASKRTDKSRPGDKIFTPPRSPPSEATTENEAPSVHETSSDEDSNDLALNDNESESGIFLCKECGVEFEDSDSLELHGIIHASHKNCPICKHRVANMQIHLEERCGKGLIKVKTKRTITPKPKPKSKKKADEKKIRNDSSPKEPLPEKKNDVKSVKKSFPCEKCSRSFRHAHELHEHGKMHKIADGHVCDTCGERFKKPLNLYLHKVQVHNFRTVVASREKPKVKKKPMGPKCARNKSRALSGE